MIIFAKHPGCNKEYMFEVPRTMPILPQKGDTLLVDTCKGHAIAVATSDTITCDNETKIGKRFGTTFPLRNVLQVAGKEITYSIREQMIENVRYALSEDQELPF